MRRSHTSLCTFIIILVIFSTFSVTSLTSAQQPIKILIAPFKIHAQQDMSFLNSGIASMLISRLEREGSVDVIDADLEPGNEPAARAYAQKKQADYLLTGNLTIFGNSVSTDASFYDVSAGMVVVKFDEYGENSGDVLGHIDKFASQINDQVLSKPPADKRTTAKAAAAVPVAAAAAPQAEETPPPPAPETKATPDQPVKETAPAPPSAVVATPIAAAPAQETAPATTPSIWKSQAFKFNIDGLTVADVDGDGQNETVLIGGGNVHIYRLTQGKLAKVHVYNIANYLTLLSVDAVDLNQNGRAEIFITSLSQRGDVGSSTRAGRVDRLGSIVLEWEGSALKLIAGDVRYYFRALDRPDGRILVGQKRAMVSGSTDWVDTIDGKDQLFVKGLYPLVWRNGNLEEGDRMDLPPSVNVFAFTVGDIFNDGRDMVAIEQENRYLKILAPDRRKEWESGERFGGSTRYLEYPAMSGREPNRFYLPQRMIVADTNQDGKNDFLVVQNEDASRGVLGRVRVFRNGRAQVLSWNGVTMQQQWQSDVMAGHISDFAWADIDNDGNGEVVLAIGPKGGSFESNQNRIVTYSLK